MFPGIKIVKAAEEAAGDLRTASGVLHTKLGAVETVGLLMGRCVYTPESLPVQAFVPPEVYSVYKEKSIWFVDWRVLWTTDALADYFGAVVTANTWYQKGTLQYRGFRPPACATGATLSQHRYGRALDCDVAGMTAVAVREEILAHPSAAAFRFITTIEDDVKWLHFDVRNTGKDEILIVKP